MILDAFTQLSEHLLYEQLRSKEMCPGGWPTPGGATWSLEFWELLSCETLGRRLVSTEKYPKTPAKNIENLDLTHPKQFFFDGNLFFWFLGALGCTVFF